MVEKTVAIIKPDAVKAGNTANIVELINEHGFNILAKKQLTWTKAEAEKFYAVHRDRPFFGELVDYMTSGPVVIMALEKENAIKAWRDLMGHTDPAKAEPGTIRKLFGTDIGKNATHGSDSSKTAAVELDQLFPDL